MKKSYLILIKKQLKMIMNLFMKMEPFFKLEKIKLYTCSNTKIFIMELIY